MSLQPEYSVAYATAAQPTWTKRRIFQTRRGADRFANKLRAPNARYSEPVLFVRVERRDAWPWVPVEHYASEKAS